MKTVLKMLRPVELIGVETRLYVRNYGDEYESDMAGKPEAQELN